MNQKPTKCLSVFEHFVGLALQGLKILQQISSSYFCKHLFSKIAAKFQSTPVVSQFAVFANLKKSP